MGPVSPTSLAESPLRKALQELEKRYETVSHYLLAIGAGVYCKTYTKFSLSKTTSTKEGNEKESFFSDGFNRFETECLLNN